MNETQITKPTALVWFTGVISQFNLLDSNLDNLKINNNLLRNLQNDYEIIFIINYPTEEIADKYREALKENHIENCKAIFIPYNSNDEFNLSIEQIINQIPDITYYIDYSKARLIQASKIIQSDKCIHISQLIN